jgi:transposase-like protein
MTHDEKSSAMTELMELLTAQGFEGMPAAMRILFNEAMKAERTRALGAGPYERIPERKGYANGFKSKTIATRMGPVLLDVPQARNMEFYPSSLERGIRSERALNLSMAEMYVQGVSTRKVSRIMETLCGFEVSSTQVSQATQKLDVELRSWRERPLGNMQYLVVDARYEKVRHGGSVISCAVLVAVGIDPEGKRSILGTSVSLSEAEVHWRDFMGSLQARGLHGVQCIVSDDHAGLKAARQARFPGIPWQRCQFHLMQNAMHYVPKLDMRKEVAIDLKVILDAPNRSRAQEALLATMAKYQKTAPKLSAWLEGNFVEGFTIFDLPAEHRRRLRTSNLLERLNKEIKRRTRVATLFPNEESLLRLVSAVLAEIDEEWATAKTYLPKETK